MRIPIVVVVLVTLAALTTWRVTGGDPYTKLEVVRQVPQPMDPSDPLVQAGFYDATSTTVERQRQFRLGLFPTPSRILDPHLVSVATLVGPAWGAAAIVCIVRRRKR